MRPSRRRFLREMFGIGGALALGDDVLEMLDRLAPRPVVVPGIEPGKFAAEMYRTEMEARTITAAQLRDMVAAFERAYGRRPDGIGYRSPQKTREPRSRTKGQGREGSEARDDPRA